MKLSWSALYLIVLGLWVGGMALFTFLVTPAIFRSFDRDMAGLIVDKLFPQYFTYLLVLSLLALALYVPAAGVGRSKICIVLLAAAIAVNAYTLFKLHPDALSVKRQIVSFEREPRDTPARKAFSRLHAVSAVLNLLVMADGIILLVIGAAGRK